VWDPEKIRQRYDLCLRETRQRALEYEHPQMLLVRREIDKAQHCYTLDMAIGILEEVIAQRPDTPNISLAKAQLAEYREDKKQADARLAAKKLLVAEAKNEPAGAGNAAQQINEVIGRFMKAQEKAEPGTDCWANPEDARHIFSPVRWQTLNTSIVGSYAEVRFRVEADGVGPSAVRNGTVHLTFKDAWKIQMVTMERR